MRHLLLAALAAVLGASSLPAAGLLIPDEKALPPLAMLRHHVTIAIDDQVASTRVEQVFRNHTDRQLEATYIFPVPKGATVDRFTMWVNGKETKGELVEAKKAADIYTSIVRQTKDPGLLEYVGHDMLRMRVFPVPARGEQKVAVRYTYVAPKDGKLIEYVYPLKTDGKAVQTLEKFSVAATIKSQHGVMNVYSPSHTLAVKRDSDKQVSASFEKEQGLLDRDFQLFYSTGKDDIGLTALTHRLVPAENGFVTLLITPRLSLGERQKVPQDMVLVMDTSGSMRENGKIEQARKALKYVLNQLGPRDRFGVIGFATTVNPYEDKLLDATAEQLKKARAWVDDLDASGGTAINAALEAALKLRPKETDRPFTIVFFTDGLPTIGTPDELNPDWIYKNISAKNTANTRIFTFGVGDDVNAALLDRLANSSRALSAYVRPAEDIENKVSSLYAKMSNPILTSLKLATTGGARLSEVYPPELPDLFSGEQLVVMGRFAGKGPTALKLTGKVGKETKEFVYELTFPEATGEGREFVELLWARRKVGYLLDQVRVNGEKKELVDEIVRLAKRYGITTPYTSYLIMPDGPVPGMPSRPGEAKPPVALGPGPGGMGGGAAGSVKTTAVEDYARQNADRAKARGAIAAKELKAELEGAERAAKGAKSKDEKDKADDAKRRLAQAEATRDAYERARASLGRRDTRAVQQGKLGVDLAVQMNTMRNQLQLERVALRNVGGRQMMEVGGVWIDEGFTEKTKAVVVKAQSEAYFALLKKRPDLKRVFGLGNHLVWLTPSGTALVVDESHGKDKLSEAEIAALFKAK